MDDASSSDGSSSSVATDRWPPAEHIRDEDIVTALGAYVPLSEVTDPVDRARIGTAVYHRMFDDDDRRVDAARRYGIDERWRRRAFYTDEEDGAAAPEGYETDSDADDVSVEDDLHDQHPEFESHPPSPRSRSSSKVRFQDDITDDYDVRSNPSTSSRSILVGERWGGFEIPEVERDVGKEILYQVTQQGFNELLDILFKPKEDLLMEVYRTRTERKMWAREIELVEQMDAGKHFARRDGRPVDDEVKEEPESSLHNPFGDRPLEELLERAGYSIGSPPLEPVRDGPVLAPPSPELRLPDDDVRPTHLADPGEDPAESQQEEPDFAPAVPSPGSPVSERSQSPSVESEFDPTLPHHRPNEDTQELRDTSGLQSNVYNASPTHSTFPQFLPAELRLQPNGTTSFPAPPSIAASSPEAEATAPKLSPSPIQPLPPASTSTLPPRDGPTMPPSPLILSRWAYLNRVEREAKERGGTGAKLSFEEFSHRMAADRGRRLAFVASWIEMASF